MNSMLSPNYTSSNGVMADVVSLSPTSSVTPRGTFVHKPIRDVISAISNHLRRPVCCGSLRSIDAWDPKLDSEQPNPKLCLCPGCYFSSPFACRSAQISSQFNAIQDFALQGNGTYTKGWAAQSTDQGFNPYAQLDALPGLNLAIGVQGASFSDNSR